MRSLIGVECVMSAAYQTDEARKKAFRKWAQDWHKGDTIGAMAASHAASHAFTNTLNRPPDGVSHPLWQAAMAKEKNTQGNRIHSAHDFHSHTGRSRPCHYRHICKSARLTFENACAVIESAHPPTSSTGHLRRLTPGTIFIAPLRNRDRLGSPSL